MNHVAHSRVSLRWVNWRDRLLINPAFHRWASRFPIFSWVTRRRTRELFDLVAGFVYSQTLYACVHFDLFRLLAGGPLEEREIARAIKLDTKATRTLLLAAASIKLLDRRHGTRWGLAQLGAAMVANPSIASMVLHHKALYHDMLDPVQLLEDNSHTQLRKFWSYVDSGNRGKSDAPLSAPYSRLMAESMDLIADEILDAFPLARHSTLLDVAGGEGAFAAQVLRRFEHIKVSIFDLPSVIRRARERMDLLGYSSRTEFCAGNVFNDALPTPQSLISLVRIIHDHDDAAAMAILKSVRTALAGDGELILAEPMAETPGAEPIGHAYFGWYLHAMGSGRPRTALELRSMLLEAGFTKIREIKTSRPILVRLLVAS